MLLNNIKLNFFRNHRELFIEFPELLYISGDNGAGKTSVIEAIFLLLTNKTFKTGSNQDIITFGEDFFRINGTFNDDVVYDATYFYQDKKTFLVNGDKDVNVADYSYQFPVICYSPYFETILSPNHKDRRNFLDRIIFYTSKAYMETVRTYNAILLRKRAELQKDKPNQDVLHIINEQLTPISQSISNSRYDLVERINSFLKDYPEFNFMEDMHLSLSRSYIDDDRTEDEIESKRPLFGCHKDLLYIKQNKKIVEKFQSFGQKKSCLLMLLYHITTYIEKKREGKILLLLDDFEAGLDNHRCEKLYELFLTNRKRQIVLTGLNCSRINKAVNLRLT